MKTGRIWPVFIVPSFAVKQSGLLAAGKMPDVTIGAVTISPKIGHIAATLDIVGQTNFSAPEAEKGKTRFFLYTAYSAMSR